MSGGDSKVWAHSSADTWSAATGISTYDLDTSSIKREKIDASEWDEELEASTRRVGGGGNRRKGNENEKKEKKKKK
uniref:Uncharacterized protein n=1 Tax=Caenorhabditis japonica TaxID=281687 RepID=A0A8R1E4W1_CAEJA